MKEEAVIAALEELIKVNDSLANKAAQEGYTPTAIHAKMMAVVATEAARIIRKLTDELESLKVRQAYPSTSLRVGERVIITGTPSQEYIILADLLSGYLITPFPSDEAPLTDVRIVARNRVVFIDPAASDTFNA